MRRFLPAGLALALVAVALAAFGASSASAPSACVYPTGTITQTKSLAYNACRFDELSAQMASLAAPSPTPSPSPTVTPSPSPTATTSTPTVTPTTASPSPTATTSTPTATTAPSAFPDAASTGPSGTLTTTSGNPWISTPGTIIENRKHTGTLQVAAAGVIIRNVHLIGNIVVDEAAGGSVTILDSFIDNGRNFNTGAVAGNNITIRRTEIIGGGHSMSCKWNCTIEDNWFHAQADPTTGDVHGDGILFNVADNMIVRHNTLACDMPANGNGACSAGLAMYGDWGPVQDVLVENNLFKASPAGYCMYGGAVIGKPYGASNVDVLNNVFERGSSGKCAVYGPASAIAYDAASSWTGNRWADGTPLNP